MANEVHLETFLLETSANDQGRFSVPHGLEEAVAGRNWYRIQGIVVAVQHKNKNWHTLELSHNVDNRFWWNTKVVAGIIASPNFYNRPVKIIIFATHEIG